MSLFFIKIFKQVSVYLILTSFLCLSTTLQSQTISFGSSGLIDANVLNPTSLDFGPDGRLYVSQQNGIIWAFTVERDLAPQGSGTYTATASEQITNVRLGIPNHTDAGIFNPSQQRLITGIMTAGTALNPILYVTSSDYLVGGGSEGSDSNLDTNSSMLSKLEWDGSQWVKIDLIRGLPRCEENHAINGLDMFERDGNTYLLIAQGGQTNKGAPSNNFAGTPEYMLSAAILIVNLTQLESMPVYTDPRYATDYVYDLPTLNDPTRIDIDNTHPEFPYPSGHPLYDKIIDLGDPFGGNNSLNQAFPEVGGPIQIFAPGFRNAYDILVTENGRVYTSDNGPNSLWGGVPRIYDKATDTYLGDESTMIYDPLNHYIKNEINESGSNLIGDPLHFIGTTLDANGSYYGGHPNPILAFPSKANVITYEDISGSWVATNTYNFTSLLTDVSGYFNASFTPANFPEQPELGEYLVDEPIGSSKINILDVVNSSTNGIAEYTASNFGGLMQGNILTASFSGDINRYELNASGDTVLVHEATFSGFGSIPLDVIAQGDSDIFPGTVWAATYGSNNVTVFEPSDINCLQPGDVGYDANADNDGDGFTNQDEIDNGTNICSQSSKPTDFDGDFISDLNDPDDDNDLVLDINDAFAQDPDNGTTTNLPIFYPFWNNDPGTGMFGLGFTGLMLDPTGATDYLDQFDIEDMSFGGAAGKATVDEVTGGDALEANNNQDYGFQFGVNVDSNSNTFTIHSKIESPYFGANGSQNDPVDYQSYGISFGNGDQDNYMKIVLMNGVLNNDAENGLQVLLEDNGVVTSDTKYDIPNITNASSIGLYASIDPAANTAQAFYSIDDGQTLVLLGSPITLPTSFLDASDNKGLAVSLISTARTDSAADSFTATWDYIKVYENLDGVLSIIPDVLDFGLTPAINSQRTKHITINNDGGPTDSVITVTGFNFTGTDAALFSSDISFPFDINPGTSVIVPIDFDSDAILGDKNATLNVLHSGINSPLALPLTGEITDAFTPIVRINVGGTAVTASDGGPEWEDNTAFVGPSYILSSGSPYSILNMNYNLKDASIPSYVSETEYNDVMRIQRGNSNEEFPMIFTVPLPNGEYIVNLYFANLYNGTSGPGERVLDVTIEGLVRSSNLDPSAEFGHRRAGMVQYNVTLTDGNLQMGFLTKIQNPIINAIEILGLQYSELTVQPIADRTGCEFDISDFSAEGSGGNPNANLVYSISGQPQGIDIEPTNGLVFGIIDETAVTGGPNNDGVYQVTVTVSKPGSLDVSTDFQWTVVEDAEAPVITCPTDITELVLTGTLETTIAITEPTATDNCSNTLTYSGVRQDAMALTDPYPLGDTTITWTVTDGAGNTSISCDQLITVQASGPILVSPKAYLQGAALFPNIGEETLMRDDLRVASLIPTTSPYTDAATIAASVLNTGGTSGVGPISDDIVDWVWVELRDATTNTTIIESQSALLQRDGDIVTLDGLSALTFNQIEDAYYVVIKHRNHLGVMTATAINLLENTTVLDFTDANNPITYGAHAQVILNSVTTALWTGDVNSNHQIKFSGVDNDNNAIKDAILTDPANGFNSVTFVSSGYLLFDLDLNGSGKFSGASNDGNIIKDNVLAHPANGFNSSTFSINATVPEN
ncbi:malectin domain-containing carbohydrate-binding protein [Xanthomarina sp. GH4-25]|uniref:malectin domain-containing carbohydrate-binding protein n=1 Tax=Xanthomarina sp. GH4-25 TaxID=3349335 RepID=UPI003877EAB7